MAFIDIFQIITVLIFPVSCSTTFVLLVTHILGYVWHAEEKAEKINTYVSVCILALIVSSCQACDEKRMYEEIVINRTKQIEDNLGVTLISEGIDANYFDMINYAVFGLIKMEESNN